MLQMLSFGAESLARPTADLLAARRKNCTCLISICHDVRAILLPVLGPLVESVEGCERNGILLPSEKVPFSTQLFAYSALHISNVNMPLQVLLTEALVEVSNGAKNYDAQAQFLSKLLSEPEGVWQSAQVSACFESPVSIMRLIGLGGATAEVTALRKKVHLASSPFTRRLLL